MRGQTIVEVLVGLAVAIMFGIALVSASLATQKAARLARNNSQATKLAQENIEQLRVYRDRKGFTALSDNSVCLTLKNTSNLNPDTWTLDSSSPCPGGEVITLNNTAFSRKIVIATDSLNTNKKLVTVTVTWTETGGVLRIVSNQTFFTQRESF